MGRRDPVRAGQHPVRAGQRTARRAFSLVELLIALAILGFGLLVIGAALPVGLSYTRESADIAAGQAAAAYALELVDLNVRLSAKVAGDSLVRPRFTIGHPDHPAGLMPDYEPRLKVRPLSVDGVRERTAGSPELFSAATNVASEDLLQTWLGPGLSGPAEEASFFQRSPYNLQRHAFSGLALLFPPLDPVRPILFPALLGADYPSFDAGRPPTTDEITRSFDRRIATTLLYRRYSYDNFRGAHNSGSLYEFIAIVTRRPTADHRFPEQPSGAILPRGSGAAVPPNPFTSSAWSRTITPQPWLITFAELPRIPAFHVIAPDVVSTPPDPDGDRYLIAPPTAATLSFRIHTVHDGLFPRGAIFVPAVNDVRPGDRSDGLDDPGGLGASANDFAPEAGFVPHAPTTLPIYEVVDRPDSTTVVVANNGFYPWTFDLDAPPDSPGGSQPRDPTLWPVWVMPPAFKEVVGGVPVFERRSPIIWVERKIVNLTEIP